MLKFWQKVLCHFQIRLGRPFGVAMLFAGVDHTGSHLFHLDPSGTYIKCLAKAIGAGSDGAEHTLQEHCKDCDKVIMIGSRKVHIENLENGPRRSKESCA